MIIYLDDNFKCYLTPLSEASLAVDTDVFDGKCAEYIEGYRFVPAGETWTREDGVLFVGEMIAPWRPWAELDAAQREYEREQYEDMRAALAESPTAEEIAAAIEEGVNSI